VRERSLRKRGKSAHKPPTPDCRRQTVTVNVENTHLGESFYKPKFDKKYLRSL